MTKTENYMERIKRRLPAGYDQLFGRRDQATDSNRRSEEGPPTADAAAGSATPGTLETTGQPFGATPK